MTKSLQLLGFITNNNINEIKKLLSTNPELVNTKCDLNHNTPLLLAIKTYNKEIVEFFLQNGARIDEHNYHGETALIEAVQDQNEELVKLLLVNGANIHKSDNSGDTPLILAIKNHNQELIDLLVNNGADINTQDKWGNTPLIRAIEDNNKNLISLLIKNGASINTPDKWGCTPLMNAVISKKGLVDFLINNGADINTQDKWGNTPFSQALYSNNLEILNLLFKHGLTFEDDRTFNKAIKICLTKMNVAEAKDCVNTIFSRFALTDLNKILNVFDNNPSYSAVQKHDLLKVFFDNLNLDFPSYDEFQNLLNAAEESASNLPVIKEKINNLNLHPYIAKAFLYEFDNGFYNTCNLTREELINTFITSGLSKIITFDPDKLSGPATKQILYNTDLMTEIFSFINLKALQTVNNTDLIDNNTTVITSYPYNEETKTECDDGRPNKKIKTSHTTDEDRNQDVFTQDSITSYNSIEETDLVGDYPADNTDLL